MIKQGPLSGQTLGGKYLLGDLLGKGGFGAVYQAQNQMLNRKQAVKVLLEEHFSDEKFRERFLREARTLAALDHANIVHVDDIGLEGHLIYLVMPYISGGTLQDIMKARPGPLSLEQVTRYLEQICSALGYAHAQGIAHLDLKPLNLLVHHDGRLLLSDFGLAHLMAQGAIEGGTSLQFGSPLYMAPEHFDGKPTQRSDVYALGVILYQMLTGRHPFDASTPAAIMRKHLTEPPPPLQAVRPDLPVALDAVIGKALAKQEEQRYGRAGEMLVDFMAALAEQPVQPLPGEFSGSYAVTRQSQPPAAPTLQAAQPPVIGPARPAPPAVSDGFPAGPVPYVYTPQGVQSPAYMQMPGGAFPVVPQKLIWTPGFILVFVLALVAGVALPLYGVLGIKVSGQFSIDFSTEDQALILMHIGLLVICLVGFLRGTSGLIRGGMFLQGLSALVSVVVDAYFFYSQANPEANLSGFTFVIHLPLVAAILNVLSLILLSYGLVRWQSSAEGGFLVLQLLVTIGLGIAIVIRYNRPEFIFPEQSLAEVSATQICGVFATAVFLLRPACWRQSPLVVLGFALAEAVPLLLFFFYNPASADSVVSVIRIFQFQDGVDFGASAVFVLACLLLVQTDRARRVAQKTQAWAAQKP